MRAGKLNKRLKLGWTIYEAVDLIKRKKQQKNINQTSNIPFKKLTDINVDVIHG